MEKQRKSLSRCHQLLDQKQGEIEDLKLLLNKQKAMTNEFKFKFSSLSSQVDILQIFEKSNKNEENESKKKEKFRKVVKILREKLTNLESQLLKVLSSIHDQNDHQINEIKNNLKITKSLFETHPILSYEKKNEEEYEKTNEEYKTETGSTYEDTNFVTKDVFDAQVSSHNSTINLLKTSESLYFDLKENLENVFGVEENLQEKLTNEKINQIKEERFKFKNLIIKQIIFYQNELKENEIIIKKHENEISNMRNIENLCISKSSELKKMTENFLKAREERQLLASSLKRMKMDLEREKRLNENIKMEKAFHIEQEYDLRRGWPSHHCLQESYFINKPRKVLCKSAHR